MGNRRDLRSRAAVGVLVLALGLLLGACGQERLWLRIGINPWPGYAPLRLAQDLGYFGDAPIRLVDLASSTGSVRALTDGVLEGAALTLDEALRTRQAVPDLKVVLVLDLSHGGDAILVHPDIQRPRDIEGRRVGVETTAVGAYTLGRFLERHGLSFDDVTLVWLPADQHEAAFTSGRVDAVVTFEPMRTRLLRRGARVLFDSRAIPGEIVDVLVLRQAVLERQAATVRRLIDGWYRAVDHLQTHPGQDHRRLAAPLGLVPEEVAAALDGLQLGDRALNQRLLRPPHPPLLDTARHLARRLRRWGALPVTVPDPGPHLIQTGWATP